MSRYGYLTAPPSEEELRQMRRRANENLARVNAGEFRVATPKRPRREPASADMIASGHMVLELRELMKLERRIARASEKGFEGSDYNQGMWEEVDHRIETLQEALKAHDKRELTSFVRAYNKAQKTKVQPNG